MIPLGFFCSSCLTVFLKELLAILSVFPRFYFMEFLLSPFVMSDPSIISLIWSDSKVIERTFSYYLMLLLVS